MFTAACVFYRFLYNKTINICTAYRKRSLAILTSTIHRSDGYAIEGKINFCPLRLSERPFSEIAELREGEYMRKICIRASEKPTAAYLFVLIGRHGDEFRLFENVTPEGRVRKLQDVIGSHEVKPRLILVHRVQYRLQ